MDIVSHSSAEASSHIDTDDSEYTLVMGKRGKRTRADHSSDCPAPDTNRAISHRDRGTIPSPIVIRSKNRWMDVSCRCNELGVNFRKASELGINVKVQKAVDHRRLTRLLSEMGVDYYTHYLPEERVLRAVIRGLPKELDTEVSAKDLKRHKLPVLAVHRVYKGRRRETYDMVLVILPLSKEGKELLNLVSCCQLTGISIDPPQTRHARAMP